MATSDQVQQLYITYFGRPADPSGLAYWTADATTPLSVIANGFATTPEFAATTEGRTLEQIVNNFYLDLFGRNAEAAGLLFWVEQIQLGNTTIQQVGLDIGNAALAPESLRNADNLALLAKIDASDAWTAQVESSAEGILAYSGDIGIDAGVNYLIPVVSPATVPTAAQTEAAVDALIQSNGAGGADTLELSVLQDIADSTGTQRINGIGQVESTSRFRFNGLNQTVNGTQTTFSGVAGADILTDTSTADEDVLNLTGITNLVGLGARGVAPNVVPAAITNIENLNIQLASGGGVFAEATNGANFTGLQSVAIAGTLAVAGGFVLTDTGATSIDTSALTATAAATTFAIVTSNTATEVLGGSVSELITGGNGNDTVVAGGGNDVVAGGNGADSIDGGDGVDTLAGDAGADTIDGGAGTDNIAGGIGIDRLTGGTGNDTFVQSAAGLGALPTASSAAGANWAANDTITLGNGVDIITDFGNGVDLLDVAQSGLKALNLNGVAVGSAMGNSTGFLVGDYNANTGVFIVNATGGDTLVAASSATTIQADSSLILLDGFVGLTSTMLV